FCIRYLLQIYCNFRTNSISFDIPVYFALSSYCFTCGCGFCNSSSGVRFPVVFFLLGALRGPDRCLPRWRLLPLGIPPVTICDPGSRPQILKFFTCLFASLCYFRDVHLCFRAMIL
uniref:Uncharacterized protein n=1 Tax=Anopheles funestus TaxID=62324 RepID=A0A182S2T8_ANOFN